MACFKQSFHGIWRTKIERMAATRVNRFLWFHRFLIGTFFRLVIQATVVLVKSLCFWLNVGDIAAIILILYVSDWYLMLVTSSCCWSRDFSPTSQTCHQHIWSPTSVTNIDVISNPILMKCLVLDIPLLFLLIDATIFINRCINLRTLEVRTSRLVCNLINRKWHSDYSLKQNFPILIGVWVVVYLNSPNSLSVRSSVYPNSSV